MDGVALYLTVAVVYLTLVGGIAPFFGTMGLCKFGYGTLGLYLSALWLTVIVGGYLLGEVGFIFGELTMTLLLAAIGALIHLLSVVVVLGLVFVPVDRLVLMLPAGLRRFRMPSG